MGECEQHLIALRNELAGCGVRCELEAGGVWPRLRIYCRGEGAGAEFDNNVVPVAGRWFFFWPGAEPIGPALRLAHVAGRITGDMGLDGGLTVTAPGSPCRPWPCGGCCGRPGQAFPSPRAPLVP